MSDNNPIGFARYPFRIDTISTRDNVFHNNHFYESRVSFNNEKGQQLQVRVRGVNQAAVEHYANQVKIKFEATPATANERQPKDVGLQPPHSSPPILSPSPDDLEIALLLTKAGGVNPPFLVSLHLDPDIGANVTHYLRMIGDSTYMALNVCGQGGDKDVTLYRLNPSAASDYKSVPAGQCRDFALNGAGNSVTFRLKISEIGLNGAYQVSAFYELEYIANSDEAF